jgi:hypothetical protein
MLIPKFETLGETSSKFGAVGDDDQDRVCLGVNVEQHIGHDLG